MTTSLQLTTEQRHIICYPHDMTINACAGSGKTTTLVEYAANRPSTDRILYLAFNRSVRLEAQTRFARRGLRNVDVHTAHSLAYRYVMKNSLYTLSKSGELALPDVVDTFKLKEEFGTRNATQLAAHVRRFFSYYCNSEALHLCELDYSDIISASDRKATVFVNKYLSHIIHYTALTLERMKEGTMSISHDFYLKLFQLKNISLPYDVIMFDEGQDASATMLAVFLRQKAVKIIVGDESQAIYGFRFAVNSLQRVAREQADRFHAFSLSNSFRFGPPIASLADCVLDWKRIIDPEYRRVPIVGRNVAPAKAVGCHATIGRTNISVLAEAIESLCVREEIGSLYFEGQFSSYTYMDSGASLMDILHMRMGRPRLIRNPLLQSMDGIDELKEYIDLTGEKAMKIALEVVEKYQEDLPYFLEQIKAAHQDDANRLRADRIFSTVHRCKGMEYDSIQIEDDFIELPMLFDKLKQIEKLPEGAGKAMMTEQLREEIHMLYVAVTRTRHEVKLPLGLEGNYHSYCQKRASTEGLVF